MGGSESVPSHTVSSVAVRSSALVHKISFCYANPTDENDSTSTIFGEEFAMANQNATWGPMDHSTGLLGFKLEPNEFIAVVKGRQGDHLNAIQFVTNTGRESDLFGGQGGEPFEFRVDAAPGIMGVIREGAGMGVGFECAEAAKDGKITGIYTSYDDVERECKYANGTELLSLYKDMSWAHSYDKPEGDTTVRVRTMGHRQGDIKRIGEHEFKLTARVRTTGDDEKCIDESYVMTLAPPGTHVKVPGLGKASFDRKAHSQWIFKVPEQKGHSKGEQ